MASLSEAVVVSGDKLHYLVEVVKVLEDAVLKHGMELVLDRGENRGLVKRIEAHAVEGRIPIERMQVNELENVQNLADTGVDLGLIEVVVDFKGLLSGDLLRH